MNQPITLLHLYPRDMNIYGDFGNILTIKRRLQWHGYDMQLIEYNPGGIFPDSVDIIIGGGGQDSGQIKISEDLLALGQKLRALADNDAVMLLVCGLYQLFGRQFITASGSVIRGIGLLNAETKAGAERLTGNIVTTNPDFGEIIGYENHSGQTFFDENTLPFGKVIRGVGNNNQAKTEGARYRNVIGTYLHGPILPKNPKLADWMIAKAVTRRYGQFTPVAIDDSFAIMARKIASKRPR